MLEHIQLSRRPSTLGYMLRAFHPAPGLRRVPRFPPLRVEWRGQRLDPRDISAFEELTGLGANHPGLFLLLPHVIGFRLQMVILTHPDFPVPIWRTLQIRNHLVQHRPFEQEATLDWDTRVAGQRMLDKGAELDLHTTLRAGGELVWESDNTYYYRGHVGGADPPDPSARPPDVDEAVVSSWHMPSGVGWRFAGLTGDYNGIHCWNWYARAFGFRRALHHPQLVLGQCLARLSAVERSPQRLDTWLRGPVYYDSDVELRATGGPTGTLFALHVEGDPRPAMVGRYHGGS